jgi:hypothetical protein
MKPARNAVLESCRRELRDMPSNPPEPLKPSLNNAQKALIKDLATIIVGTGRKHVTIYKEKAPTARALQRRGLLTMERMHTSVGVFYEITLTDEGWAYVKKLVET